MILESIVTTQNEDGTFNVAPMGPHINEDFAEFELKPFKTSTTYNNLKRHPFGVLHVTDNVAWFARAAIGKLDIAELKTSAAEKVEGIVLPDANRWLEFQVVFVDDNRDRSVMKCQVLLSRLGEPFWGFNRAKHAILECAILAPVLALKHKYCPRGDARW